tara:strand:+ start:34 stop:210 length:177 start_codon:yes stop_codon:yes gene_type:complete
MKLGDLIRHYDADCGTGIIIEVPFEVPVREWQDPPDILILWSDGLTEWCDPEVLELAE